MNEYIPDTKDIAAFQVWEAIKNAVGDARAHESYLTDDQIAMAILSGLAKYNAESDAVEIGSKLMELMQIEKSHEL